MHVWVEKYIIIFSFSAINIQISEQITQNRL